MTKVKIKLERRQRIKKLILTGILMVILTLAVPMTALAATTTTNVTGTVPTTIILNAPTSIDLGNLNVGGTKSASSDVTITASCNDPDGWTLTVRDEKTSGSIGQMMSGSNVLANVLKVKGGDLGGIYMGLPTSSPTTLMLKDVSGTGASDVADFNVQQRVETSDVPGTYSLILLFTLTAK